MRSPSTTVTIDPPLVAGIAETLLTIYAARADALHHAVNGYLARPSGFWELDEARRALWATESALDGVGWTLGHRLEPAELTGPASLVHDTLAAAVIDAAEELAETCRDYTCARADIPTLQRAFDQLTARHALLAEHEREEAT